MTLDQLRADIDRGLRARRFLGYRESAEWASQAGPIVAEFRDAVDSGPSSELVMLVERATAHVVKVILHADDSDGLIGDQGSRLQRRLRLAEARHRSPPGDALDFYLWVALGHTR